jgi:hypothetical protein
MQKIPILLFSLILFGCSKDSATTTPTNGSFTINSTTYSNITVMRIPLGGVSQLSIAQQNNGTTSVAGISIDFKKGYPTSSAVYPINKLSEISVTATPITTTGYLAKSTDSITKVSITVSGGKITKLDIPAYWAYNFINPKDSIKVSVNSIRE